MHQQFICNHNTHFHVNIILTKTNEAFLSCFSIYPPNIVCIYIKVFFIYLDE